MTLEFKTIFGVIGLCLGAVKSFPYLIDIFHRKTKPHFFSWFIWSLLLGIGFAGRTAGQGGFGTLVTMADCIVSIVVCSAALKYGEKNITRSDWITFIFALMAIPLWLATKPRFMP